MKPQDLIRAAAKLLDEKGWCQPGGNHAETADGVPVTLWSNTRSTQPVDTSRVSLNPQAARFSIYGAMVAAHMLDGTPLEHGGLMWNILYEFAREELGEHAPGGTNYVHPIIAYNETKGRTKEQVLAFMEHVAKEIEATLGIRLETTGVKA